MTGICGCTTGTNSKYNVHAYTKGFEVVDSILASNDQLYKAAVSYYFIRREGGGLWTICLRDPHVSLDNSDRHVEFEDCTGRNSIVVVA